MNSILIDTADQPHLIHLEESGEYEVRIVAEGAEVEIKGGWQTRGTEEVNIQLKIHHQAKHTRSNTLLRGVGHDASKITLSGTIIIDQGAQDTNAFLTENILLLSPRARAEAVPNLEISANEVKCSHAATVSQIPEEHLFYLMSRGLTRAEAEDMIVEGFLLDVL